MEVAMRLRDRVAIVTGAGSGIGRASARRFALEGAKVVVADVVEEMGLETVAMIGDNAVFCRVDVSSAEDVDRMVSEAIQHYGRVDILFNNAGINVAQGASVVEISEAEWDNVMAVNLSGVFLSSRSALQVMMKQQYGVIINMASQAGIGAGPRLAAYCTSKGGVVSLTKQLAIDYAPYNIRVNCICPSALARPVTAVEEFFEKTPGSLDARNRKIIERIPLGKLATVEDVAYAALYLASDEASYVTGVSLLVDGGALAL